MKLAVLGNSHVGMLRAASLHPDYADHSFAWMARHTPETSNFRVDGTWMRDDTQRRVNAPGMATELDLAVFDAVIIAGNTVRVNDVARIARTHVVPAWVGMKRAEQMTGSRLLKRAQVDPITEAAFTAILRGHIQENMTWNWVSDLLASREIPIFVVPPVFAREAVLSPKVDKLPVFREIKDESVFPGMAAAFNTAHLDAFQMFGSVEVLLQDPGTVTKGFFTLEAFSNGATGLNTDRAYDSQDMTHGNQDMGRIVMDRIIAKLTGA